MRIFWRVLGPDYLVSALRLSGLLRDWTETSLYDCRTDPDRFPSPLRSRDIHFTFKIPGTVELTVIGPDLKFHEFWSWTGKGSERIKSLKHYSRISGFPVSCSNQNAGLWISCCTPRDLHFFYHEVCGV